MLNVLWLLVDNLSPRLGSYGVPEVVSPNIDALAASSTVFSNAHCQVAWCAPSRNSFLSGRRPRETRAYNFLDSFREGAGAAWTTLPGYFLAHGYYTTGAGKVFHPNLPANNDFPFSWSDAPFAPSKEGCPGGTMFCALPEGALDVDAASTTELLSRLAAHAGGGGGGGGGAPFFAALGLQAPRLPWAYPPAEAARYPPAPAIPISPHGNSSLLPPLEYFRPTEIDQFSDVRNVSHGAPMAPALQREARRAYYATVSSVDTQVGRVLAWLAGAGLLNDTVVALSADHGQNLGEQGLWSMMSLQETSTRVPLLLRGAPPRAQAPLAASPVELVDLYPTLAALAGLPPPPAAWALPGVDLSPLLRAGPPPRGAPAGRAAFSQITRCWNCSAAYAGDDAQCQWDAAEDGGAFAVPCALAPRGAFDVMGVSVRTAEWRYSVFCAWDGARLAPDFSNCSSEQLYDHRREGGEPLFDPEREVINLAGDARFSGVQRQLRAAAEAEFSGARG